MNEDEFIAFTKIKSAMLSNIKFIGELFKLRLIPPNIINTCIRFLLDKNGEEESISCLVKLLETCGGSSSCVVVPRIY